MQVANRSKVLEHRQTAERGRIGILGGTFDPVHYAHLHMAEVVKETFSLDAIWFTPAASPPHKVGQTISPSQDRLQMLQLALADVPYFHISLIEWQREGPSYTYETMVQLKNLYPNVQFYFIIGGDMLDYLDKWYKVEELVQLVRFVSVGRPNWEISATHPYRHLVDQADIVLSYLSSTEIRQRVATGKSIRFLVPEAVRKYIEEKQLYA